MVELHGLWDRPAATTILQALAPYRPSWVEDPLRPDAVDALDRLAADVEVPHRDRRDLRRPPRLPAAAGSRGGRCGHRRRRLDGRPDRGAQGCHPGRRLRRARRPPRLHRPGRPGRLRPPGPGQPNGLVQETVRAFLRTWYADLVDGLPAVQDGQSPPRPGRALASASARASAIAPMSVAASPACRATIVAACGCSSGNRPSTPSADGSRRLGPVTGDWSWSAVRPASARPRWSTSSRPGSGRLAGSCGAPATR